MYKYKNTNIHTYNIIIASIENWLRLLDIGEVTKKADIVGALVLFRSTFRLFQIAYGEDF